MDQPQTPFHISITGLRLKAPWHAPRFWYHATRSMVQAQAAPGNISATALTIEGVHHTRSVWTDRRAMITYLRGGAHARAMAVFPKIATGKVLGLKLDYVPDWPEVRRLWDEQGRPV